MCLPSRLSSIVLVLLVYLSACGSGSGSGGPQSGSSGSSAALTETKAAYPYSDPLCMALSPDQKMAFVGEGAALTLLGLNAGSPGGSVCLKSRLPIDVACFALLPVGQSVFLCGGKLGLSELITCSGLSDSCAAGCESYPVIPIERVENKLCIAAVAVHGHAAGDLLLALYSAKDDSECRVYDLAAPHALRGVTSVQGGPATQGMALAADPQDPNRVYAALGSGGLVRLDIGNLDHIAVEQGPVFDHPDQMLFGHPSKALDLAIAGGFLYAAIDKGGLVEIDLSAAWSADMRYTSQLLGCGPNTAAYAYRVSALVDEQNRILVAVGTHNGPAQSIDGGPFSLVGAWDFALGVGNVPDSQPGDPTGCSSALYLFGHAPAAPGASTSVACTPGTLCAITSFSSSTNPWRSLSLRRQGASFQACECRRDGFRLLDLGPDPFSRDAVAYSLMGSQTSTGIAPVDGVVSSVDPSLLYLSDDAAGSVFAGMVRIGAGNSAIETVPNTNALCASPTNTPEYCDIPEPAFDVPLPFKNGLYCTAHWVDPTDPAREWFVAGETAVYEQCVDPCAYSDQWCQSIWKSRPTFEAPQPGWKVLSFLPGIQDGALWQLRWWQIPSPPDSHQNSGRNYVGSFSDPRPESTLLHLTRSGIGAGYIVCDRSDLMSNAEGLCSASNGRGQELGLHFLHVLSTHYEFADVAGTCVPSEAVALTTACTVFSVDVSGVTRWVAAISSGFPANPCASAVWAPFYQRAMVVFYDVTTVDMEHPPKLLRFAFGPEGTQGNAFAVRTEEIAGRTYAYAADIGGRLLVFDVSSDVLFPAPEDPTQPATGLLPTGVWTAPLNSFDGYRDNVIDVAVIPPYVYLATGRRGVTVLDVATDPEQPHEIEASPILTPGLALGLTLRQLGSNTTLLVGDSRAGLRLYGKH